LVEVWLPYGSSDIPARVPEERLIDILRTQKVPTVPDVLAEANRLLESSEQLQMRAREAKRICIVLGPCGSAQFALDLIKALQQSLVKNSQAPITILCAPGAVELDSNAAPDTKILRHDPESSSTLPIDSFKGFPLQLNSEFVGADLRIAVGELRPQQFLRYSGLSDVVFPGLASGNSVRNHLTDRPGFSTLDLRRERFEIASLLGDTITFGVILNSDKTAAQVVLDTMKDSILTLEDASSGTFSCNVAKMADIVVMSTGGAPQDETLLQAVETFPAGLTALKKNGALIVAAECGKGHGDTEFYEWCAERKETRYLEARLRRRFNYNGFKAAYLQRILESHRVYLVSTVPDHYVESVFGMKAAQTVNAALQSAQRAIGSDSTISVIPDASRVILRQPAPAQ
jgi:nickel-dependent lactate racemase